MNHYGQDQLAFRAGTHATFKQTMLERLAAATNRALRTREDDDLAIALLDAWALAADVLTFYDERLLNEFYLRTATDRASVVELAKLVGYRPRPGLAASTWLAYTLDDPPPVTGGLTNARGRDDGSVEIPTGAKAQNTPKPQKLPQTFETTAPIVARAAANALHVRVASIYWGTSSTLIVKSNAPIAGDAILASAGVPLFARVLQTAANADGTTTVTLDAGGALVDIDYSVPPSFPEAVRPASAPPFTDAAVYALVTSGRWEQADLADVCRAFGWPIADVGDMVDRANTQQPIGLYAWVMRAAGGLYGDNAPNRATLPASVTTTPTTWDANFTVKDDPTLKNLAGTFIDLDNAAPWITAGAPVVATSATTQTVVAQIVARNEAGRTDYGIAGRVTRLQLGDVTGTVADLPITGTSVFAAVRALDLTPPPAQKPVHGTSLLLERCVLWIAAGDAVAISGESADRVGVRVTEVATAARVTVDGGRTRLWFDQPLVNRFVPASTTVNANVAPATHGESRSEIVGSGDASVPFQRFPLAHNPLTWISAAVPGGIDAALLVRVNGVAWKRVDFFYGRGPRDRIYVVEQGADGKSYVRFGDGVTGARVPTGSENVAAVYRQGLGADGLLDAHELTLALTRPPGVRAVDNPAATSGAADPETLDDARANAAMGLRALDRVVSLDDYTDFARASGGIAKADGTFAFHAGTRSVVVTVAGPDGAPVVPGTRQAKDLSAALSGASAGTVGVALAAHRPVTFRAGGALAIDPAYDGNAVRAAVEATLRARFGFGARAFAQGVARSEVIAAVQNVEGVVAVQLTALYRSDESVKPALHDCPASPASIAADGTVLGAELLTLDPGPLTFGDLA